MGVGFPEVETAAGIVAGPGFAVEGPGVANLVAAQGVAEVQAVAVAEPHVQKRDRGKTPLLIRMETSLEILARVFPKKRSVILLDRRSYR